MNGNKFDYPQILFQNFIVYERSKIIRIPNKSDLFKFNPKLGSLIKVSIKMETWFEINQTEVKMDNLLELPFEQILPDEKQFS